MHVRDLVAGVLAMADAARAGLDVFNVGSGRGVTVSDVVAVFEAALGRRLRIEQDQARLRAVERPSLVADNGKLSRATGWTPRVTLETGIAELVNGIRPLRG